MTGSYDQKQNKGKVILVIPAYNEADNLPKVVADIKNQKFPMDYIIVSDGSTDDTVELCKREHYNFISLPANLGLAGCFQTGMKYAFRQGYSYAVQFDGDGQHRAEDIENLYKKMREGDYDIVQGSRFLERAKGTSMREIGSRLISIAIKFTTGRIITDPTCGLRMYSWRVIDDFANKMNFGPEPDTISYLIKNGARVTETQVTIEDRLSGESYLRPLNAMVYMARMLISILVIQSSRVGKS